MSVEKGIPYSIRPLVVKGQIVNYLNDELTNKLEAILVEGNAHIPDTIYAEIIKELRTLISRTLLEINDINIKKIARFEQIRSMNEDTNEARKKKIAENTRTALLNQREKFNKNILWSEILIDIINANIIIIDTVKYHIDRYMKTNKKASIIELYKSETIPQELRRQLAGFYVCECVLRILHDLTKKGLGDYKFMHDQLTNLQPYEFEIFDTLSETKVLGGSRGTASGGGKKSKKIKKINKSKKSRK